MQSRATRSRLKPSNGLLCLLTVRHTLCMPLGNTLGPFVFHLPAAILDPDATEFLIQQGLEQLAPVMQVVLQCRFAFCRHRTLDRVRLLVAQSPTDTR